MKDKLTADEIWAKKDFSFSKLLEPYVQGGTESQPVKRTIGTIMDWLINKKKYPVDVAGAGLLFLFMDLKGGKMFEGDGSYGSPGRALVTNLRFICDGLLRGKLTNVFYQQIAEGKIKEVSEFAMIAAVDVWPFFLKPFLSSWWKIRKIRKARKK